MHMGVGKERLQPPRSGKATTGEKAVTMLQRRQQDSRVSHALLASLGHSLLFPPGLPLAASRFCHERSGGNQAASAQTLRPAFGLLKKERCSVA